MMILGFIHESLLKCKNQEYTAITMLVTGISKWFLKSYRGNALLERDITCSSLYAGHSHHHVDPRVTVHPQSKKQGYTLTQACFRRCRLCPILLFNQHREECHAQLSFLSMSSLFLRLFTSFAADAGPLNQVGILGYVKPNNNN